jgi:hypothetical protein
MVNNYNSGPMEENIKVIGKTENNTARANFSTIHQEFGEKAFGMMENELDGLLLKLQNNFLIF